MNKGQPESLLLLSSMRVRPFFLVAVLTSCPSAFALDANDLGRELLHVRNWHAMEFLFPKGLMFRVAATSLNDVNATITFDMKTNSNCESAVGKLVYRMGEYQGDLAKGLLPIAYKLPGSPEVVEAAVTSMSQGDPYAFITFSSLSTLLLQQASDEGNLIVWIPGSGDGVVKRGPNMYFDMAGFKPAFQAARLKCLANI